MALQRVRSLATTKFTDENVANLYVPAAGEMISIFVNGTYRGLRIGDGATVGGLSLVNSGSELYEYIGEAPPDDTDLPVVDPVEDSDSGEISTPAPVVDETTGLVEQTLVDARLSGMNSLLFDGGSYLSRTFGTPTDASTWTYSFWVKRTILGGSTQLVLWTGTVPTNDSSLGFHAANNLEWYSRASSGQTGYVTTTALYRDTSAWYHFVVSFDHDTSPSIKFYVNGSLVTDLDNSAYPSSAQTLNTALEHRIGNRNYTSTNDFIGRMANIQFIDGMALDANYFGEYLGANWVPKVYEGAYGANGFWLDFNDLTFDDDTGELVTVKDVAPLEGAHTTANDWQAA